MHDALIIGAGPVGLAATCALQKRGLAVSLCGMLPHQGHKQADQRTAALFDGSIRFLKHLGAWSPLETEAAPLKGIRIIDATERLLRAPEQMFHARDVDASELGFNIANPALVEALLQSLQAPIKAPSNNKVAEAGCTLALGVTVERISHAKDHVAAELSDGTTQIARIAIAADGRRSRTREAAGIEVKTWDHDQAALTAHLEHTLPHGGISTEIHTLGGPCTVVPMSGERRSSLVWMDQPEISQQRADMPDQTFIAALDERLADLLGPITHVSPRRLFPLSSLIATTFAQNRVALVGEAGHAFPPIGAQGLNLGLRDVASLADHLANAHQNGGDIGAESVLAGYSRARWADVNARTYGVDAFNRSLATHGAGLIRGAILHATRAAPSLKRLLMERGTQPIGDWPTMMR